MTKGEAMPDEVKEEKPLIGLPEDTLLPIPTQGVRMEDLEGNFAYGKPYASVEYDNGSVTGTATINWANGNVQYVTMTGNTTFTFTNPLPGMRMILHMAGAFTPTWPSTVKWPGSSTPTATASAGKKDLYTFVYSPKENFYDGGSNLNYAAT